MQAGEFAIVTLNPNLEELRLSQVKMLYRGRASSVNGATVRLADLPRRSEEREMFYQQLLKKSPSQMSAIWARQSFSGKALTPAEISEINSASLLLWLKANINGIAYIPFEQRPEEAYVLYHLKD
ncbi:hypothetical protein [Vibrio sp. TBV020]|uniref:hypothetical protein n=1 Tax=Vibrio sp. TBV020 TaxID=3137398 RepID=UPI0038CD992E